MKVARRLLGSKQKMVDMSRCEEGNGTLSRLLCIAVLAIFLAGVLFSAGAIETYGTHNPVSGVCAAFAEDGTLATGTLLNGELETKLYERDVVSATTQEAMTGFPFRGLSQGVRKHLAAMGSGWQQSCRAVSL